MTFECMKEIVFGALRVSFINIRFLVYPNKEYKFVQLNFKSYG